MLIAAVYVCSVFETSLPRELPIVHEITTVLREWHHLWKELYLVNLTVHMTHFIYLHLVNCNSVLYAQYYYLWQVNEVNWWN